ncbi:DUF2953 domain-containing protein [Clostridium sp. ZS2-4]|uniref:DUF2953 domain-containing protein n=1 Tax=Clostridium sp. ZS2-4 TaxID=2987703 RepID=UPI00227ADB24|nr:DUF2953 domain-containing protein [Clostridium sp. ZS2-4]MCY6354335.1 DUF2953 domain-containing protein [Clostridium sp. ZS2-4]
MIWLLITLIFLFLPLPLLITIGYKTNTLSVYIFGIKLYPGKKSNKKLSKKTHKKKKTKKISLKDYKEIWNKITNNPFKPSLYFKFNMIYGLDDAAKTAILYGTLSSLPPFLYNLFSYFFHTKKFKIDFKPIFEKSILEFKIKSIIWINFAKIIYMSLLVIFTLKNNLNKSLN